MNNIVYVGKHSITYHVPIHEHDSWEMIYCTSDSGTFEFKDFSLPYTAGEIVVIPPMMPHLNISQTGFTNIHLNMTDTTLNIHQPTVIHDDSNRSLFHAFSGAYYHYYENASQKELLLSAYGNLIVTCLIACQETPSVSKIVREIEASISRHYADSSYALDEYLKSLPYSYDYLRKLFQKELGVTPLQYLNNRRLQTAANMLCSKYNSGNVSEVAHLCGFREPLYFSRMFRKKYGVSPSFYYTEQHNHLGDPLPDSDSMKIKFQAEDE